jgi:hypothetical protein
MRYTEQVQPDQFSEQMHSTFVEYFRGSFTISLAFVPVLLDSRKDSKYKSCFCPDGEIAKVSALKTSRPLEWFIGTPIGQIAIVCRVLDLMSVFPKETVTSNWTN